MRRTDSTVEVDPMFYNLGQTEGNNMLRQALGLTSRQKLPDHYIPAVELGHGFKVYLSAPWPKPEPNRFGRVARRMAHRIYIICLCGKHVPAGRMRQHLRAANHNTSQEA